MDFKTAWGHIAPFEGGYVNDPQDPGGETNYGISKAEFPNEDIKNMTPERAAVLMQDHYWNPDACSQLPSGIDLYVFDMAINMGIITAARVLQTAINKALPPNITKIQVDGRIGPQTLIAINAMQRTAPVDVLIELDGLRAYTYGTYKNFDKYGYGWERRAAYMLAHGVLSTVPTPAQPVVVDRSGDLKNELTKFLNAWT